MEELTLELLTFVIYLILGTVGGIARIYCFKSKAVDERSVFTLLMLSAIVGAGCAGLSSYLIENSKFAMGIALFCGGGRENTITFVTSTLKTKVENKAV